MMRNFGELVDCDYSRRRPCASLVAANFMIVNRPSQIRHPAPQQSTTGTPWLIFFLTLSAFSIFNFDPYYPFKYSNRNELVENVDLIANTILTADDPRRRVGLLALGLIGACLLCVNYTRLRINNTLALALGLFLLWACASLAGSDDFDLTLRRIVVMLLLMIAATGLAVRCSLKDIALFGNPSWALQSSPPVSSAKLDWELSGHFHWIIDLPAFGILSLRRRCRVSSS